jgi:ubiquinone/menaquinone biosynthesis C-methylase UbiE
MGWWERTVVPRITDKALGTEEVAGFRERTCAGLTGRVLEVGFGSGLNVDHYPAAVTEVAAVEPNDTAWRLAAPRVEAASVPVARSGLDGQRLEEPDDSFDSVLLTFVLCTIPDQVVALREAHRVLRPGGTVHFVEHGLAPDASVQRWQRRLEPLQRRMFAGCHLTRNPVEDLTAAGFTVTEVEASYLPGPALAKPYGYGYLGTARKGA